MNIRRIVLDVDKAIERPSLLDVAKAIDTVAGVEAFDITVTEIDMETVGTIITVEGVDIDYESLIQRIESTGAMVHSLDGLVVGSRDVAGVERRR
jgi:hypothetical protein